MNPLAILCFVLESYGFLTPQFQLTLIKTNLQIGITIINHKEPWYFMQSWGMIELDQLKTSEELEDYFSLAIGPRQKEYLATLQKTDPVIINQHSGEQP